MWPSSVKSIYGDFRGLPNIIHTHTLQANCSRLLLKFCDYGTLISPVWLLIPCPLLITILVCYTHLYPDIHHCCFLLYRRTAGNHPAAGAAEVVAAVEAEEAIRQPTDSDSDWTGQAAGTNSERGHRPEAPATDLDIAEVVVEVLRSRS